MTTSHDKAAQLGAYKDPYAFAFAYTYAIQGAPLGHTQLLAVLDREDPIYAN